MWDLWWPKWRWGRFSPTTLISPANLYSTNFSTITYHFGLVQYASVAAVSSGLSLTPLRIKKKNAHKKSLSFQLRNSSYFHLTIETDQISIKLCFVQNIRRGTKSKNPIILNADIL
jgi:hypothetical protein